MTQNITEVEIRLSTPSREMILLSADDIQKQQNDQFITFNGYKDGKVSFRREVRLDQIRDINYKYSDSSQTKSKPKPDLYAVSVNIDTETEPDDYPLSYRQSHLLPCETLTIQWNDGHTETRINRGHDIRWEINFITTPAGGPIEKKLKLFDPSGNMTVGTYRIEGLIYRNGKVVA